MGARDKEDNFSLKDPAILRMRLVSEDLSFDIMIVRRESTLGCASLLFSRSTLSVQVL